MEEWAIRAVSIARRETKIYAGNAALTASVQVNLQPSADNKPSALELLLSALAADVVEGYRAVLERRGIVPFGLELALKAKLGNVLVHLGVIGESGDPGLASVSATLYVSADADEAVLRSALDEALRRASVFTTLARAATIELILSILP